MKCSTCGLDHNTHSASDVLRVIAQSTNMILDAMETPNAS